MAATGATVLAPAPAVAAPVPQAPVLRAPGDERDDEGGTDNLRKQLDAASRGFLEAQEALAASKKKQAELAAHLKTVEAELATRSASVGEIADQAYRVGRVGPLQVILNAGSPSGFLDKASTLQAVAVREDRTIRALQQTRTAEQQAKTAIELEIRNQQKQVDTMAARKKQAENALKAAQVGGDAADAPSGGSSGGSSRAASFSGSSGSCSANDPTTSGCITPRTLHALKQAQNAGFKRFVSCFRSGGGGEHPKGRACDFAAQKNGFGGVASGGDKTYGTNLANYYINNASRLGVLYVIWFKRIWLPSSGWRAYSRGNGDPSSDHTNHVHLSMR
ncbi:coiled-coil domain-containing protein [Spirilliplanes yamanashiensis]